MEGAEGPEDVDAHPPLENSVDRGVTPWNESGGGVVRGGDAGDWDEPVPVVSRDDQPPVLKAGAAAMLGFGTGPEVGGRRSSC